MLFVRYCVRSSSLHTNGDKYKTKTSYLTALDHQPLVPIQDMRTLQAMGCETFEV